MGVSWGSEVVACYVNSFLLFIFWMFKLRHQTSALGMNSTLLPNVTYSMGTTLNISTTVSYLYVLVFNRAMEDDATVTLLILGDSGCGKTTFLS